MHLLDNVSQARIHSRCCNRDKRSRFDPDRSIGRVWQWSWARSLARPWSRHSHLQHGHWHGHGLGIAIYSPTYVDYSDCYTAKRVIDTPFGPRVRRIKVCG